MLNLNYFWLKPAYYKQNNFELQLNYFDQSRLLINPSSW